MVELFTSHGFFGPSMVTASERRKSSGISATKKIEIKESNPRRSTASKSAPDYSDLSATDVFPPSVTDTDGEWRTVSRKSKRRRISGKEKRDSLLPPLYPVWGEGERESLRKGMEEEVVGVGE